MEAALSHPVVAAFDNLVHQRCQPLRIEQTVLHVRDCRVVHPVHRHSDAGAALLADPSLGPAGVVAVALPVLLVPVRRVMAPPHRPQKQMPPSNVGPPRPDIGGIIFGLTRLSDPLHSLELGLGDDGWHVHHRVLALGLDLAGLVVRLLKWCSPI